MGRHESVLAIEFDDGAAARRALSTAIAHGLTEATVVDRVTRVRSPRSFLAEPGETPAALALRLVAAIGTAGAVGVVVGLAGAGTGLVPAGVPVPLAVALTGLSAACVCAAGWTLWFTLAMVRDPRVRPVRHTWRVVVFGDARRLLALRELPAFR